MTICVPTEIDQLEGVHRIENCTREAMTGMAMEMTRAVYPHDQMFGQFVSIQQHVDCPPDKAFEYLSDVYTLQEWTYSLRDFTDIDADGMVIATDKIGGETKIYTKTFSNPDAMTVDYHCAWDQGDQLWMIYLMRVVPAEVVLDRPGSVILWTNCKHPNYDMNPYPDRAPEGRKIWVGEMWPFFYAGHVVELNNLARILEFRHANSLPMTIGCPV